MVLLEKHRDAVVSVYEDFLLVSVHHHPSSNSAKR